MASATSSSKGDSTSSDGSSRERAILRPTSRILLLDEQDRVLLFTVATPDQDTGRRFWFPPGGGLEEGETNEEAARRELIEETGLVLPVGRCIWVREWTGMMAGAWYRATERYFVARTSATDICHHGWTEVEQRELERYHWWSVDEMRESNDVFVPSRLPELLPSVIAGDLPAEPFDVGV